MIQFGENVYLWRIYKELSQQALAKKSGIPRPNLSAIEKGRRSITLSTLRALSFALGIKPGLLVDGIPPFKFKKSANWPRKSLENTAWASLGVAFYNLIPEDRAVSSLLLKITKNRVNAPKRIYKNTLKLRKDYIKSWLILKSGIGKEIVGNLLSRQDKLLNSKINE